MAGRLGWNGVLRPMVARLVLNYWARQDADVWVNQRLLVMFVREAFTAVDKETVRAILDSMVDDRVLLRKYLTARRTVYRASTALSDPTSSGYARQVDELLEDPISWVTPAGIFFRVGLTETGPRWHQVASFPHHFAKHAWMRSWLHAFARQSLVTVEDGLEVVATAARAAVMDVVRLLRSSSDSSSVGEVAELVRRTVPFRGMAPGGPSKLAAEAGRLSEHGLRLLHDLCGHSRLRPVLGAPVVPTPKVPLPEHVVYRSLDACVAARLDGRRAAGLSIWGHSESGGDLTGLDGLFSQIGEQVHRLDRGLRRTLTEHRRAWPRGVFSSLPQSGGNQSSGSSPDLQSAVD
jgi:hypothetical protein